MTTSILAIIVINFCSILGALGALYLKKGTSTLSFSILSLIKNKNIIIGILIYAISTVFFIPALKFGDLSVLYPFVATTYVWGTIFSIKFLKEKMNIYKWIGLILIIIGVTFTGLGSG